MEKYNNKFCYLYPRGYVGVKNNSELFSENDQNESKDNTDNYLKKIKYFTYKDTSSLNNKGNDSASKPHDLVESYYYSLLNDPDIINTPIYIENVITLVKETMFPYDDFLLSQNAYLNSNNVAFLQEVYNYILTGSWLNSFSTWDTILISSNKNSLNSKKTQVNKLLNVKYNIDNFLKNNYNYDDICNYKIKNLKTTKLICTWLSRKYGVTHMVNTLHCLFGSNMYS